MGNPVELTLAGTEIGSRPFAVGAECSAQAGFRKPLLDEFVRLLNISLPTSRYIRRSPPDINVSSGLDIRAIVSLVTKLDCSFSMSQSTTSSGPSPHLSAATKLRQALKEDGIIVAPGVFDGFSARIALDVGFDAIYMVCIVQGNLLTDLLC